MDSPWESHWEGIQQQQFQLGWMGQVWGGLGGSRELEPSHLVELCNIVN